ncbi:chorion peroxidase-like [Haliotis cracherodii]|uniref:chorion peroxidase-like n=1 Tax=Haliotis cracherodii TaxID=6455 RepID=UPI0039E9CDA3
MKVVLFVCMLTVVTAGEADKEVNNINSVIEQRDDEDKYVVCTLADAAETSQISLDDISTSKYQDKHTIRRRSIDCKQDAGYRTMDGSCNNARWPTWGSTNQPFKRFIHPAYDDGKFVPRMRGVDGYPLPSPRAISVAVHPGVDSPSNDHTVMVMQWGQFVDHDLTGTPLHAGDVHSKCCDGHTAGEMHSDVQAGGPCFPITMPVNEGHFQKNCMEFKRSAPAPGRNTREQLNLLTSFVDASNVYGLSQDQINHLRNGPFMKIKGDNLLPESNQGNCRTSNTNEWCFEAGDDRVNVFPGLAVLHTVFVREHNRLVKELADVMPSTIPDDVLFEEARKIVSAIIQQVTYREWLPIIVGPLAMRKYKLAPGFSFRYNFTQNPTIYNVFATAAFRYGHSTIPRFLTLGDRRVPIEQLFNRPSEVIKDLDTVLKAILKDRHQGVNRFINSGMTEHLFETSGNNGFDIMSLNIQRGRDHGLPSYNNFRKACQLSEVTSFDDSVFGKAGAALKSVYRSPDDIDVSTGAVAEHHVHGGAVGPLLACLIGQQFHDLKYGDSFWFETSHPRKGFTSGQLSEIRRMRFAKILCRNSGVKSIQRDPFTVYSKERNPTIPCNDLPTIDLTKWRR